MILNLIIIVLVVLVLAVIANVISDVNKKGSQISFKESMDLTELPVVTFYNKGRKVNFLLDTGSNVSYINSSILPNLFYKELNKEMETIGIEGNQKNEKFCEMNIEYKKNTFTEEFCISNLDKAFNLIKQESGVTICGILGSLFFQKYEYVLDFKDQIIYIKK